jgi:hypothetical protein
MPVTAAGTRLQAMWMARGPVGAAGNDDPRSPWGSSSLDYKKLACGDKKIEGLIFFDRWRQLAIVNQDGSNRLILRQFNRIDFAVDFLND